MLGRILMPLAQLIAIVEVDVGAAIRCQALGCNHTVFRRIHLVTDSDGVKVIGSSCFKQAYADESLVKMTPLFTTKAGKILTAEEQQLLHTDIARLVLRLESQHILSRMEAGSKKTKTNTSRGQKGKALHVDPLSFVQPAIVALAKKNVASRMGVDPNLPGWRGHVVEAVKAILRENAA